MSIDESRQDPAVQRESADEALLIVKSYGPWGADLNDAFRRQIVLADEVRQLRNLYEMAVRGRAEMRAALRAAIKQHVAEEVAKEREELLDLVDSYAKDNADLKDAIRASAEKETK